MCRRQSSTGNRKQNEGEGKKRPSRGIPKIPKTGLTFDGQEKSTYDFINHMLIEAERLLGVFTSIVVNGKPSPRELMDAIGIAMGYFAYGGRRLKDQLDMAILENVYAKDKVVAPTKELYAYLVIINRCYAANKEAFDSVDVLAILHGARNAILGHFDTLESITQEEESNYTSAISGLLYYYRRLRYEKHNRKSISGHLAAGNTMESRNGGMRFLDKDGKPVENVNDDNDEYDEGIFFFETYKFSEQSFDGFMMAYEAVSEYLMHIDTAINDSESFSFENLNAFIEELIWMLDGMYDSVSEQSIRGKVTERERSEFGNTPKLFDNSMLRAIYNVVNGRQFENIPYEYFSNSVNAPATPTHLVVMPQQIKKVCFLIDRLACSLPHERRYAWVKAMIDSIGINEKTYKAKRRSCVGSGRTADDDEYVTKLNRIAKKYNVVTD